MTKFLIATAAALFSTFAFAGPVNVNTADAATLDAELRGVGPVIAQRIVEHRETHGEFRAANDLTAVRGIGDKVVANNAEYILLD